VTSVGAGEPPVSQRVSEPTPASVWHGVSGGTITDSLLDWPPDLFTLMATFP
jgi:hypothetical protein